MEKSTRIISVVSLKGGVGKTTSTVTIASALADKGAKCLIIDFDPSQANATLATVGPIWNSDQKFKGVCSSVIEGIPLDDVILSTSRQNLFIAPSEKFDQRGRKYSIETAIGNMSPTEGLNVLKDLINESNIRGNYDFVFVDTGPTGSMIVISALNASDYFMVPVQLADFSIGGLEDSIDTAKKVISMNPNLSPLGYFVSSIDKRAKSVDSKIELLEKFSEKTGIHFFKTKIPVVQKMNDLPSEMKTILDVGKSSERGHKEYLALSNEILRRVIQIETERNNGNTINRDGSSAIESKSHRQMEV